MKPSRSSALLGISAAVVIATVAAGLIVLGSPAEERERRLDERRVTDLRGIAAATDLYWTRHSRLPRSLDELAAEPGVRISAGDPVTSEAYSYRVGDGARYEVCADFERESVEVARGAVPMPPIFQQSCQLCHGPGSPIPMEPGELVPEHLPAPDLWAHRSGRGCFGLEARLVPRIRSDGS